MNPRHRFKRCSYHTNGTHTHIMPYSCIISSQAPTLKNTRCMLDFFSEVRICPAIPTYVQLSPDKNAGYNKLDLWHTASGCQCVLKVQSTTLLSTSEKSIPLILLPKGCSFRIHQVNVGLWLCLVYVLKIVGFLGFGHGVHGFGYSSPQILWNL